jgi:hypothetical protein
MHRLDRACLKHPSKKINVVEYQESRVGGRCRIQDVADRFERVEGFGHHGCEALVNYSCGSRRSMRSISVLDH